MNEIVARKLLQISNDDLFNKIKGNFTLVFDDGEKITSSSKEIYFSSFFWEFHKLYPNTPLLAKHHVSKYISDSNRLGSTTPLKLLENLIFDVFDSYKNSISIDSHLLLMEELLKLGYTVINNLYNELSNKVIRYSRSLDILDFLAITEHPSILEHRKNLLPTQESIDSFYKHIKRCFNEDRNIKNNNLVKGINCGIVNIGQALQCVGVRGFITDIDSNLFKAPITSNYVYGMQKMYDMMIDSRSASKALIFSVSPLQDSSYFDRRQQLIVQIVNKLHLGDCGSTKYFNWLVRDVKYSGNTKLNDCDLNTLAGKYYLDEESNSLKIVKKTDKHLIGKYLKLRSPIAGCGKPVCSTCFGDNYTSITRYSNLGHLIMSNLGAIITQAILSTKHLDGSSEVEGIVLNEYQAEYLTSTLNGSEYYLNEKLKGKNIILTVDSKCAYGLIDIEKCKNIDSLSLSRISNFENITLNVSDENISEEVLLDVFVNDRLSSFTHEMLKHIKEVGWKINNDGNYVIDLSNWNFSLPMLSVPDRHFNMSQTQKDLASFIETQMGKKGLTVEEALITLIDIINRRFNIPLANIEVILLASMWVDPFKNNFSIPTDKTDKGLGNKSAIYANRSLSAVMSFQQHKQAFNRPKNYLFTNRVDHPICDYVIMPTILNDKYKM